MRVKGHSLRRILHPHPREPLIKSAMNRAAVKNERIARPRDEGYSYSTTPGSATPRALIFDATLWGKALQAICCVKFLMEGINHSIRHFPCISSRKAIVATMWDLIRGSLALPLQEEGKFFWNYFFPNQDSDPSSSLRILLRCRQINNSDNTSVIHTKSLYGRSKKNA